MTNNKSLFLMDSSFGEFITKEYGLLKQILSYLKPSDLHNARLVCREWRRTVDNLVDKNPLIISYKHGESDPMPFPSKPILPDLVIYQNVVSREFLTPDNCKVCKRSFLVCYCQVAGPETAVISLNNLTITSPYKPQLYSFWQIPSIFILSSPNNVRVSTYYCDKSKKALTKHSGNGTISDENEPIKAAFVVTKSCCRKVTEKLLSEVVDKQGPTFAVGGGLADAFFYRTEHDIYKGKKQSGLYITFSGDGVTAHSELIKGRDEASIEKSMAELKQRVGEVPAGGTQLAFIAQCVDRRGESLEKLESGLFRKYFPDVPQCGFPAWGEFGIKNGGSDDLGPRNRNKRRKFNFFHSYTTSILIITLRKQ